MTPAARWSSAPGLLWLARDAARQCVAQVAAKGATFFEEVPGPVALHPGFEGGEVLRVRAHLGERHLVRSKRAFHDLSVDLMRSGPALRGAQDQHRPLRSCRRPAGACGVLEGVDVVEGFVEGGCEALMSSGCRLVELDADDQRPPAVALEQGRQLALGDAREHGRVGDLVAVQVEDRQHGAVAGGVQELVAMPAGGERAGLGLAVADDAGDDQVGVVEGGPVGVAQGVAELAALVDAAGRLRGDVRRDAAREAELLEQPLHALRILADVRVDLAVGALEPGVGHPRARRGHQPGTAVAGPGDEDHVEVALADGAVEVDPDEVEAGGRAPVAEEARLDVAATERAAEEGVVVEVDLPDREVVGGPPVRVEFAEFVVGERLRRVHDGLVSRSAGAGGL